MTGGTPKPLVDVDMDRVVQTTTFRVFRYNGTGEPPAYKDYEVPTKRGMTVLDGLLWIKENLDGSLSYRASCRMGVCGSCAMMINGKPRLACQTQILDLQTSVVVVEPLKNYPVVKDLVPALDQLFEKHEAVKPYVMRPGEEDELENPSGEFEQSPEELDEFIQFTYCIKCGICLAACPTVASDPLFLGPQALAQAYRYVADTRDTAYAERCDLVDDAHGVWRCHYAGACTEACPKGVDPAFAIQLLKKKVFQYRVLGRRRKAARVAPKPTGVSRRPNVPEPPPRTVNSS